MVARGGLVGRVFDPVAGEGLAGKGVGDLSLQWQVHPSVCSLHQLHGRTGKGVDRWGNSLSLV